MDDQTNDRDSGLPPGGSPEELEEALKWLEELTARQGKPAELSNPVPPASLDSPFRGLIDNDEGDLPDWLREVPSPPGSQTIGEEPESRLDWLAKMAQRESIEELPTLEWRRLSEPVQSAILGDHPSTTLPVVDDETGLPEELVVPREALPDVSDTPDEGIVEGIAALPAAEDASPEVIDERLAESEEEEAIALEIAEHIPEEPEVVKVELLEEADVAEILSAMDRDDLPPIDDLDAAMAWIEELAVSQDTPIEEIPSVADRALASKLMMEAGLPASLSPLDEIGSDSELVDGLTPTHPFIEEEDFADTVVLVETLAADEGAINPADFDGRQPIATGDSEIELDSVPTIEKTKPVTGAVGEITTFEALPDEPVLEAPIPDVRDEILIEELAEYEPDLPSVDELLADVSDQTAIDEAVVIVDNDLMPEDLAETPADELSFEEAMALLDEMAVVDANAEETAANLDIEPALEAQPSLESAAEPGNEDELLSGEASLDEIVNESVATELETVEWNSPALVVENANGHADYALEAALSSLDALALPPGKSLNDIDTTLRTAQATSWRDVNSALDWLEAKLAGESKAANIPVAEMDEEELIARMPEDPDAVLAWLEQLAADEETRVTMDGPDVLPEGSSVLRAEPLIEEMAEADLLDMPEDPDEAMLWLEGLARGSQPAGHTPIPSTDELVEPLEPEFSAPVNTAFEEELPVEMVADSAEFVDIEPPQAKDIESEVIDTAAETLEEYIPQDAQDETSAAALTSDLDTFAHVASEELSPLGIDNTLSEAEDAEMELPAELAQESPTSGRKPRRSKTGTTKGEPAPEALEEVSPEPDTLSWVDLLKPLD